MFREHRAIDDAADEKLARDAAEGKMRAKRRTRGIDFDSEESDEEDPDMKRRRLKLHKKRKIDGDTLDALGTCAHPAPRLADANGVCEEKHP